MVPSCKTRVVTWKAYVHDYRRCCMTRPTATALDSRRTFSKIQSKSHWTAVCLCPQNDVGVGGSISCTGAKGLQLHASTTCRPAQSTLQNRVAKQQQQQYQRLVFSEPTCLDANPVVRLALETCGRLSLCRIPVVAFSLRFAVSLAAVSRITKVHNNAECHRPARGRDNDDDVCEFQLQTRANVTGSRYSCVRNAECRPRVFRLIEDYRWFARNSSAAWFALAWPPTLTRLRNLRTTSLHWFLVLRFSDVDKCNCCNI